MARCWWSAGGIRLAGSLNLVHNSNFDVIGSAGVPVSGCRSPCYSRSVTKAAQGGWAEARWASRRHLHRRDWRCVDRLAIARDSDRRTCCVAEANAGGQRSGEESGGRVGERARVVAEHGVVVAGSGCIASVGAAGRRRWWCWLLLLGTRRRNKHSGGVGGGGAGGAEGVVMCRGGVQCNGQCIGRGGSVFAVYIRVDRRAQCDVVLTSMLLLLLVLASNPSPVRFLPRALTACTQKHKHERFSASPAVQIAAGPSIETQSTT